MPIMLHFTDLPTPDMAWIVTSSAFILVVDRRVPRTIVVEAVRLALAWIDSGAHGAPPRPAAA